MTDESKNNGDDWNGPEFDESDFDVFEGYLASLLNQVFRLMLRNEYTKFEIEVVDLQIGKYIRSHDPLNEIVPISTSQELSPGSAFFLGLDLSINGRLSSFRGNFYIDDNNNFVPLIKDVGETDVEPEQVEADETLSKRTLRTLDRHWERIWDIIKFAIDDILQGIKAGRF